MVGVYDLMNAFGYKYDGATYRLPKLHKERLIQPLLGRGEWGLTEAGIRRLRYLEKRDRAKQEGKGAGWIPKGWRPLVPGVSISRYSTAYPLSRKASHSLADTVDLPTGRSATDAHFTDAHAMRV